MKETVIDAFADKAVLERLFTNGPGELLAVNSKAGYLKAGQDVYMLCSADLGITPIGIAVDDYAAAAAQLCGFPRAGASTRQTMRLCFAAGFCACSRTRGARRRNRVALSARRGLRPLRDCSVLLAGQADLCRLRMPSVWGRRRKKV